MRIGNAIYQLSEIQRTRGSQRIQRERSRTLEGFSDTSQRRTVAPATDRQRSPDETITTLGEMLREHFVNEVRRRDRDGDGMLNQQEHGGAREDFAVLDRDGDGLISARDLIREALNRSPQLTEMVAGPWAPIYDRLLTISAPDSDRLVEAIREGAEAAKEAQVNQQLRGRGKGAADAEETLGTPTEIYLEFVGRHGNLTDLYQRLQDLANRLGRTRQYSPVDLMA